MYKALINFIDADTGAEYRVGDIVSVDGKSKERIAQMTSRNNQAFAVLIEQVEDTKTSKEAKKEIANG